VRVLFVAHNFPRHSGDLPGNFLLTFARALVQEGVEVRVVAPHAPDIAINDVVDGIPVVRFQYAPEARETLAYTGTMASQVRASNRAKLHGRTSSMPTGGFRRDWQRRVQRCRDARW
jgi:hypothetical protein